jgi:translation initiation factor IF-2
MMEKEKVGEVFHYFTKAGVAAINLTDSYLQIGDTVLIQGVTTNLTQKVESMQVENTPVQRAEMGQSVGIKVSDKVREKDLVYRVVQE